MGNRLGGIREHHHPAPVRLHDPYAIGRVHEPVTGLLHDPAHHQSLDGPGSGEITLEDMRPRNPRIDLAQRELRPRHQPDEAYERRRAVEDTAELRDDETTTPVATKDRRVLTPDPRQIVRG